MSLNILDNDDAPLFFYEEHDEENAKTTSRHSLTQEAYNNEQENSRKNKVLSFCFKASRWILFFAAFLIFADFFAQSKGWESTLIKDCLSLVTYTVTAALGFMFGSNSK